MLEQLTYINHLNETLEFGQGKLFVNENDLRNFSWEITSKNNKISGFKRGIVAKTIPLIIVCDSEEEGTTLKNKVFEVFEKDVLAIRHGKIAIGDYYLKCYVTESTKAEYLTHKGYMRLSIKISTDSSFWIREISSTFNYGTGKSGKNLDYRRDFPSDYTSNLAGKILENPHFVASNFRIHIYGTCENPRITVAGHKYEILVSVEKNEYLTIDSVNKTVFVTHSDGTKTNMFNKRNKDSYIFEKIPAGQSNVSSSGPFKFDIILLEERSEPKWT